MAKAICPNCGASLGCSCQLRTGSDGKKGCSRCINEKPKQTAIITKPPRR